MRTFILLLLGIFSLQSIHATTQVPDHLIYKNDTFQISIYPLEKHLGWNQKTTCGITACWRGYSAIWEIKNDSLFLVKLNPCFPSLGCDLGSNLKLLNEKTQRKNLVASWFTDQIVLKSGKYYKEFDLHEFEERISFTKGKISEKSIMSNIDRIKNLLFKQNVIQTKDTFLYYLNRNSNLRDGKNTKSFNCFDEYLLTYDKNGKILNVQLLSLYDYYNNPNDSLTIIRKNVECSRTIMANLKPLSLKYINPTSEFKIIFNLHFRDKLKFSEFIYYEGKLGDKDNLDKDNR
jgi:hypothetical protein